MSNAFAGRSTELQRGDGATPEVFTTIAEMKKFPFSGSKADLADVTNMDSGVHREFLPTLLDSGELAFDGNYIASDATQGNVNADFEGQVLHNWKIVLPGSRGHWSFAAYVTSWDLDFQVDKEVSVSGKLKITGARTFAAS